MSPYQRICALSVDEVHIKSQTSYDENEQKFYGNITLGEETETLGCHILSVMIRGVSLNWKQVIAFEVTGTDIKQQDFKLFIDTCIQFAEKCGLYVISLMSDMGNSNQSLWSYLGVQARKKGKKLNTFFSNGHLVYVIADMPHLLKNLKAACLRGSIWMSAHIQERFFLPTHEISGRYVIQLWELDVKKAKHLQLLYHLKIEDIYRNNFQKMNVGAAVCMFSFQTAAALFTAIECSDIEEDAKTTAWFILKIASWFSLVSARTLKKSVTRKNCFLKENILLEMIELFEDFCIDGGTDNIDAWKPLNVGMIMSSLSLYEILVEIFLKYPEFFSILFSRFAQDALENVYSQMRQRSGQTPSVLDCIRAFKLITLSQFVSDLKNTNYANNSDLFLIDYLSDKSNSLLILLEPELNVDHEDFNALSLPNDTSATSNILLDLDILCFLAASTTHAVLKNGKLCKDCQHFLLNDLVTEPQYTQYIRNSNLGGLKYPNKDVFKLVYNLDVLFKKFEKCITENKYPLGTLIDHIVVYLNIDVLPDCCSLKHKIVKHFSNIRSYALANFSKDTKRKREYLLETSTPKRTKV